MIDTKTEVLVIGAGSIGVNSAHFLTERGFKVTLLDKDDVINAMQELAFGRVKAPGMNEEDINE